MKPLSSIVCMLAFAGSLSSCGDKEPIKAKEEVKEHHHPSDWIPEDAALVAGKAIYKMECSGCHDEGEENAPALGNKAKWEKRIAKGVDKLTENAIQGFIGADGEMPARGGTESLTDEEVANAVKFMINTPR